MFTKKLKKNKTFFENLKFIQTTPIMLLYKKKDITKYKKSKLYILYYMGFSSLTIIRQKEILNNSSLVSITQKKHNPKAAFFKMATTFTITLGVCLKYLKIHTMKAFRRNFKYTKYFINLIKVVFFKERRNVVVFSLNGLDYNLFCLRKMIANLFLKTRIKLFFLFSIKIPFCKIKNKKIKSIKKRLKKKILLDFLEK